MAQFNHTSYHTNALIEDFYTLVFHSNTHSEKNKVAFCCKMKCFKGRMAFETQIPNIQFPYYDYVPTETFLCLVVVEMKSEATKSSYE